VGHLIGDLRQNLARGGLGIVAAPFIHGGAQAAVHLVFDGAARVGGRQSTASPGHTDRRRDLRHDRIVCRRSR
jgi:hypothetical protein